MKLQNGDIIIDDNFPCSSAGEMRIIESGINEIGYKPEEIPQWFQDLLDELFDGAGVPKEYMAHVRVRHRGNRAKWATLRFLLSKKGASYMYPPWWIWRENTGWAWVPYENTDFHPAEHIDISVHLQPGETIRIASAPYEDPSDICEKARQLSEQYDIWTYREIGHSAQGRPICVLETKPRDLTLLVDATMQSCEPVSWGILHVAHSLTIPTARTQRLLDHVQFCLMPITNPDGVCEGRSVTNAIGEVPKFGINHLVEGKSAPRETAALWQYFLDKKPDASIEVHAHFTRPDFTRSIGMHDKASMPRHLQKKAEILEQAILENYHIEPLKNRKVLIDPRQPEHNVYGDKHICEQAGTIRTFLQAIPDSIDSHNADVKEMVETVAHALIKWRETGAA